MLVVGLLAEGVVELEEILLDILGQVDSLSAVIELYFISRTISVPCAPHSAMSGSFAFNSFLLKGRFLIITCIFGGSLSILKNILIKVGGVDSLGTYKLINQM